MTSFQLIGHINPAGAYPAPLIPVGMLGDGRVVACYTVQSKSSSTDERSHLPLLERVSAGQFEEHSPQTAEGLSGFHFGTHFLFAITASRIVQVAWSDGPAFFARLLRDDSDLRSAGPFARLVLAEQTGDPHVVGDALRACARHMTTHLPRDAAGWFEDSVRPLMNEWQGMGRPLPIPSSVDALAAEQAGADRFAGVPRSRRRTIALLVDALGPYQGSVLTGVAAKAESEDVNLLVVLAGTLRDYRPSSDSYGVHQLITRHNVDGVVLMSGALQMSSGDVKRFADYYAKPGLGIPVVSVAVDAASVPSVTVDAEPGLTAALRHLIRDHGHRQIAFIGGPAGSQEAEERRAIFERVTRAEGVYESALMLEGDFMMPGGRAAAEQLLDKDIQFDAIVAASDAMAIGALEALKLRPRAKPVSVIGFDDLPDASVNVPSLTTVHQPLVALGTESCARLLALVDASGTPIDQPEPSRRKLRTELKVRNSCAPHAAAPEVAAPTLSQKWRLDASSDEYQRLQRVSHALGVPPNDALVMVLVAKDKSPDEFLSRFKALLEERTNAESLRDWPSAVAELREYLLASRESALDRARFETLLFKAAGLVSEALLRAVEQERSQRVAEKLALQARRQVLGLVAAELARAKQTSDIIEPLRRHLPSFSRTCCLCLHREMAAPFRSSSSVLAIASGKSPAPQPAVDFPAGQLAPPDLFAYDARHSVVIVPLRPHEPRGYFMFDLKSDGDWRVYEDLAEHVGRALAELAERVGDALQQARMIEQQALGQRVLGSSQDADVQLKPQLDAYARVFRDTLKADIVTIYPYLEHDESFPVREVGPGLAGDLWTDLPITCEVQHDDAAAVMLRRNSDLYVSDTESPPEGARGMFEQRRRGRFIEREGIKSMAALLLRESGVVVGVMFVSYRHKVNLQDLRELISICAGAAAKQLWESVRARGSMSEAPGPSSPGLV
jgi:DNA-binding LacI/PurR family transcriptional regulator